MDNFGIITLTIMLVCCLTLSAMAAINSYGFLGNRRDIKSLQNIHDNDLKTPRLLTDEIRPSSDIVQVSSDLVVSGKIHSVTTDQIKPISKDVSELKSKQKVTDQKLAKMTTQLNNHQILITQLSDDLHRAQKRIATLESRLVRLGTAFEAHDVAHSTNTYFNHI